ncbi:MAG: arylsulfatase [Isosphaeraceae bacterium]
MGNLNRLVWGILCLTVPTSFCADLVQGATASGRRPNVLVIITDDQGIGDFGWMGNPVIRTPNLDRLARESVRLTRFHVSPVCSPTRSSLMTGRYNYRTPVVDTYVGRSMMAPDEVTIAEMLGAAGYRTAIFGKWHLGDTYPMRPIDQGFQEALVLRGGGIGQPSDPPDGTSYFDPVLQHNGRTERRSGYCSDVFTDAAIDYIRKPQRPDQPFFIYLAFNCPHDPLEVPESYRKMYADTDLSIDRFPRSGFPLPALAPPEQLARVYGMITNIDDNLGRLFAALETEKVARDTIVVFLTDNGPAGVRYTAGLRGRKGTVYDGGIRVPALIRWTGTLTPAREIDRIAAHIDLAPTLLEACGVAPNASVKFDGKSLWPLILGKPESANWPDRTLFFQWHRGDVPEKYRAFAARDPRYKLVKAEGPTGQGEPPFQLFDMHADPSEEHDIAAQNPAIVDRLKDAYSRWFDDVTTSRGFAPLRTHLGSPHENLTVLTRQDWHVPSVRAPQWAASTVVGNWEILVERPAVARLSVRLKPARASGVVHVRLGSLHLEQPVRAMAEWIHFDSVALPVGPGKLEAWIQDGEKVSGVWSINVECRP